MVYPALSRLKFWRATAPGFFLIPGWWCHRLKGQHEKSTFPARTTSFSAIFKGVEPHLLEQMEMNPAHTQQSLVLFWTLLQQWKNCSHKWLVQVREQLIGISTQLHVSITPTDYIQGSSAHMPFLFPDYVPVIRRRENWSFPSADMVRLKGIHVGSMAWLLTFSFLRQEVCFLTQGHSCKAIGQQQLMQWLT